jgi:hypothetical protein
VLGKEMTNYIYASSLEVIAPNVVAFFLFHPHACHSSFIKLMNTSLKKT